VFFAELANATEWIEICLFAAANGEALRECLELPEGVPSHDTIERVTAVVSPECLQEFRERWNEIMTGEAGGKVKKILALGGKTQRGNGNGGQKANHIVSAADNGGFCIGEALADDKSNEITAIPQLLEQLNVRGALHEDVKLYFEDTELRAGCAYRKTAGKAHGAVETREYRQADDIAWLQQRKAWAGLASIVMTKNTIIKGGDTVVETRYFTSGLPLDARGAARTIRSHWMVGSYHWHLDVTFREDANRTLDKAAAYNLSIIKKMAINTLKLVDVGIPRISVKNKHHMISMNFRNYWGTLTAL
jgi:predicted transposase YbfD/YdcC